ncbi:CpaF family protein [Desulfurivibrio alkaliphilus]|uniref:Type II secretion system protein E n=1 Tax=Desulfurivibrio alkaliphilus (strain DSM 19089 / UNIQEM U267 / AHT2) TaxID=589865 RepID=D6Z1Q1_DESAT|nr:CpaF family protein [Desulfurivibrio alkaliphilus]ADH85476.1 type II secretion system protein E [Desulfurivibrio alkaliphilus AHT 2]
MNYFDPLQDEQRKRDDEHYQQLKKRLHRYLIKTVEAENALIDSWSKDQLRHYITGKIGHFVADQRLAVNRRDGELLTDEMIDELRGFGPIQQLIEDDEISDILVNGPRDIYVERQGKLSKTALRFIDNDHVMRVIHRILAPLGRRVDETVPLVDARLPDGGRVNAIIPPLSLCGPCISIRKFRRLPLAAGDLLTYRTWDEAIQEFLRQAVNNRCNILVTGGSGAGKTTLLNVLANFIAKDERIVTIEDAAELSLNHPHVVSLETRPPNLEGQGEITTRMLVRNALRMRPERIIVGEVRGEEMLDMLQAMNTGHDGSMGTLHANSPRDALNRLEMLAGFAGYRGSEHTLRQQVAAAIDLIVQVGRLANGERKVLQVQEVTGVADQNYLLQELFHFDQKLRSFQQLAIKPHNRKLQQPEKKAAAPGFAGYFTP